MNSETIMKFKCLFEDQKRELGHSHGLTRLASDDLCLPAESQGDEADLTSMELNRQMQMRLRARQTLYLNKIDQALRRINAGTFGDCCACGQEIEVKRLEARPTATHCIACKEEQERRELLHIDGHRSKSLGRLRLA